MAQSKIEAPPQKLNYNQNNFNSGEISPKLYARTDLDQYANAVKQLTNLIPLSQGGASKRSGFKYVASVKFPLKETRFIKFIFNITQSYVLEFGDQYIRFFTNNGQLMNGAVPYEISSDYLENDISGIKFAQSGDILFLFHPLYPPKKLSRVSSLNWTLTDLDYLDGPFDPVNTNLNRTMAPTGTSGIIIINAVNWALFSNADIRRLIRIKHGSTWGCAKIISIIDSNSCRAEVQNGYNFGATTPSTSWRLGSWCPRTGYPSVGTFYQQRLILANNTKYPDTVWGSMTGDFEVFSPTNASGAVADDNGFNYSIGSDQINAIIWMNSSKIIQIGTAGGEWLLYAGSPTNPDVITPTSIAITKETTYGSINNIDIFKLEDAILFVDLSGRKIREFVYDYKSDSYIAQDITILAEHITKSGIKQISWAQNPNNILWLCLNDGTLISVTYIRNQKILAFAKHEIGGRQFIKGSPFGLLLVLTNAETIKPKINSLTVIPSPDGSYSQLWVIVERIINGSIVQYVEYMVTDFDPEDENDKEDAFFIDSGAIYSGVSTNTISGLNWLEGEEVQILGNGSVQPSKVVSGGSITLDNPVTKANVGLKYIPLLETLDPSVETTIGTIQNKMKRINKIGIRLYNTLGVKYGSKINKLFDISFRNSLVPMDSSPPLFTGLKYLEFPGDYERESSIFITQDEPYPLNITSLIYNFTIHET